MVLRVLLILVAATAMTLAGCKDTEPAAPAEVEITEENLASELDKMEKQIEAEIAAE